MQIHTSRFGSVAVEPQDLLLFRDGLIGYSRLRQWVLLADVAHPHVAWLQSATNAQVALAVVSPRRFKPDYQVRVSRSQLDELELSTGPVFVLVVLSHNEGHLTLNLRAPIILNPDRHLGRQVVTLDEQPLQFSIAAVEPAQVRRSA
jgi:flagellar assembly factor FliW